MNMERINVLIEKINHLRGQIDKETPHVIDIDLMMDYTRVLYADLSELRQAQSLPKKPSAKNQMPVADSIQNTFQPKSGIVLEAPIQESSPVEPVEDKVIEPIIEEKVLIKTIEDNASKSVLSPTESKKEEKDIRHFITINDRFLYMSELFKNDKFDYESALDIINNFSDKTSALNWLSDNYFKIKVWNQDDSTVQAFVQAIENRF